MTKTKQKHKLKLLSKLNKDCLNEHEEEDDLISGGNAHLSLTVIVSIMLKNLILDMKGGYY